MNKFIATLALLFLSTPTLASVDHWTCSNDKTVLYFILDTAEGKFMMFDDGGRFLAAAKFTSMEKTKDGTPFLYSEVTSNLSVAVAKAPNGLKLALTNGKEVAEFSCL